MCVHTTSPPSTPEPAAAESRSSGESGGRVAVFIVIVALGLTAAWMYVLVLLASWLVSAIF